METAGCRRKTMSKKMNPWIEMSIEYANQRSYLDDLFTVYPTIPEGIREIDRKVWKDVERSFEKRDNILLLSNLFKLDLFPIKDSYVAYLKRDKGSLKRNPATVNRLAGRLYEMGLEETFFGLLNRKKPIDKSVRFSNAGSVRNLSV